MKKIVRLTESDLARIVRKVIMENETDPLTKMKTCLEGKGVKTDPTPQCAALLAKVVAELPNIDPSKMPDITKFGPDFIACSGSLITFPPDPKLAENVTKLIAALPICAMESASEQ